MSEVADRPPSVDPPTPSRTELARLSMPAKPRSLRLARLAAAALAVDLGLDTDAVEDVRIGVDELCAVIIEDAPSDAELVLVFRSEDGGLVVEGRAQARTAYPPELRSVARELLGMVTDEYAVAAADGRRNFRMTKHAKVQAGGR